MNLKSKIISLAIVLFLGATTSAYSQGVFKNQSKTTEESTTTNSGVFRDPTGGPGDEPPGNTPVGEGLAILSLLSGGYFMLKRRNSKK
jgi:hypothetical protein